MKRKRCGGATGRPTLIQLEIPHIDQGRESIRIRDTRPMYRVPQVPHKTQLSKLSFLPSLAFLHCRERRRCTASVLSPVSPLFYDRRFRRPQRHRAKPIPLRRRRNFFACERNITTVLAPSYHVAERQHITSHLRDISLLSERN